MLWLCVTPERVFKSRRIMDALHAGWPDSRVRDGAPPNDGHPFMVWGQIWLAEQIIPKAIKTNRPFWQIDNGFYLPDRGTGLGYHRICYRGLSPIRLDSPDMARGPTVAMAPWRKSGRHVLLALPGEGFGRSVGLNMPEWIAGARNAIAAHTDRPIRLRPKGFDGLADDLTDCWAVVTHSSNVAVDAVCAGVPVFVALTNPAAPVGNLDLAAIENPAMPDGREEWWRSLMSQQFSLEEMRSGVAFKYLAQIRKQVDG